MHAISRVCVGALLLVVGMASAAAAQQTGALNGAVRDAQGGILPGVTDTATSGTTAPRTGVTNEQGTYSLTGLPVGTYSLTFELTGFGTQKRDEVIVQVNRTTDGMLEIALYQYLTGVVLKAGGIRRFNLT